jgi:hypothetical protein
VPALLLLQFGVASPVMRWSLRLSSLALLYRSWTEANRRWALQRQQGTIGEARLLASPLYAMQFVGLPPSIDATAPCPSTRLLPAAGRC